MRDIIRTVLEKARAALVFLRDTGDLDPPEINRVDDLISDLDVFIINLNLNAIPSAPVLTPGEKEEVESHIESAKKEVEKLEALAEGLEKAGELVAKIKEALEAAGEILT